MKLLEVEEKGERRHRGKERIHQEQNGLHKGYKMILKIKKGFSNLVQFRKGTGNS